MYVEGGAEGRGGRGESGEPRVASMAGARDDTPPAHPTPRTTSTVRPNTFSLQM